MSDHDERDKRWPSPGSDQHLNFGPIPIEDQLGSYNIKYYRTIIIDLLKDKDDLSIRVHMSVAAANVIMLADEKFIVSPKQNAEFKVLLSDGPSSVNFVFLSRFSRL